jgi:hypothetical protein
VIVNDPFPEPLMSTVPVRSTVVPWIVMAPGPLTVICGPDPANCNPFDALLLMMIAALASLLKLMLLRTKGLMPVSLLAV